MRRADPTTERTPGPLGSKLPRATGADADPERSAPEPKTGLSPWRVFAVLMALVACLTAWGLATKANDPEVTPLPAPNTSTASEPDYSLTNAEAIERFGELNQLRIEAYKTRSLSSVDLYVIPESELATLNRDEIKQLRKDRVFFHPLSETQELVVVSNTENEIVLRQVSIEQAKFLSETGKDISETDDRFKETTIWTLRLDLGSDEWKFFKANLTKSKRIPSDR